MADATADDQAAELAAARRRRRRTRGGRGRGSAAAMAASRPRARRSASHARSARRASRAPTDRAASRAPFVLGQAGGGADRGGARDAGDGQDRARGDALADGAERHGRDRQRRRGGPAQRRGDDLGSLIGRRGEKLASLQHIVNLIVGAPRGPAPPDRDRRRELPGRREEQLRDVADRAAKRVMQTRQDHPARGDARHRAARRSHGAAREPERCGPRASASSRTAGSSCSPPARSRSRRTVSRPDERGPMDAPACAVGRLGPDGPWVGFAPTLDDGYALVDRSAERGGSGERPPTRDDLLALAVAYFEDAARRAAGGAGGHARRHRRHRAPRRRARGRSRGRRRRQSEAVDADRRRTCRGRRTIGRAWAGGSATVRRTRPRRTLRVPRERALGAALIRLRVSGWSRRRAAPAAQAMAARRRRGVDIEAAAGGWRGRACRTGRRQPSAAQLELTAAGGAPTRPKRRQQGPLAMPGSEAVEEPPVPGAARRRRPRPRQGPSADSRPPQPG